MEEEVQEAEDAGARKRKRGVAGEGGGGDVVVVGAGYDREELLADEGDGDGDDEEGRYEGIAEEAVAEVMRWLEAEIADGAPPPPAALGVAVDGYGSEERESCGASFSAAASTVMASVDARPGAPAPPRVPWPWPPQPQPQPQAQLLFPAAESEMDVVAVMGGDQADEAWVAELLTCGPVLEVEGVL